MDDDQSRVLQMLAEGKIDVDEAERLLSALGRPAVGDATPTTEGPASEDRTGGRSRERVRVRVEPEADEQSARDQDDTFAVGDSPRLVVDVENGRIEVVPGEDGAVRVQARLKRPSRLDYSVTQDGDTVRVEAKKKGRERLFGFLGQGSGADVKAWVPRVAQAELRSVNGRVHIAGVGGPAELNSVNGRIEAEDIVGDFSGTTVNGSIRLSRAEGSAKLRSTNGSVAVEDAKGVFDAGTVNGSISLDGEMRPGGRNRLKTVNGSIAVGLRGTPSVKVSASGVSSNISSGIPGLEPSGFPFKNSLEGVIGSGEAELQIQSVNGPVKIVHAATETVPGVKT